LGLTLVALALSAGILFVGARFAPVLPEEERVAA
jgi:hypothetical protein